MHPLVSVILLPVSLVTFFVPQVYSLPRVVLAPEKAEAMTLQSVLPGSPGLSTTTIRKEVNPASEVRTGEGAAKTSRGLYQELIPVCSCESSGNAYSGPTQFDINGNVIRGKINNLDYGACQINLLFWGSKAVELGYDLDTIEGNYAMANYIYEQQGLSAWKSSQSCWLPALQAPK